MRCIGHLDSQSQAEQLGHYLFGQDIENQVDENAQGQWEIWVLDEDQIEQAKSLLQAFSELETQALRDYLDVSIQEVSAAIRT